MSEQDNASNIVPEFATEEDVFNYTQNTRKKIVKQLFKNDTIPGDKSEQIMLMQALDGLDRTALGTKRIKAEQENAKELSAAASAAVANVLKQVNNSKRNLDLTDVTDVPVPVLSSEIPDPELVPGETEVGATQLDYNTFMSKMKPE